MFASCRYICSFIAPIVDVIRYVVTNAPSLVEIYETSHSMLDKMKKIVAPKDPTLGFYEEHTRPIVTWSWNIINTLLHVEALFYIPNGMQSWVEGASHVMIPRSSQELLIRCIQLKRPLLFMHNSLTSPTFVALTWERYTRVKSTFHSLPCTSY